MKNIINIINKMNLEEFEKENLILFVFSLPGLAKMENPYADMLIAEKVFHMIANYGYEEEILYMMERRLDGNKKRLMEILQTVSMNPSILSEIEKEGEKLKIIYESFFE